MDNDHDNVDDFVDTEEIDIEQTHAPVLVFTTMRIILKMRMCCKLFKGGTSAF